MNGEDAATEAIPAAPDTVFAGRRILTEWANEQDHWVRTIIAEVLSTRRPPSATAISVVYERFLVEKGLAAGTVEPAPALGISEDEAVGDGRLEVMSLSGVAGVNALAADQTIEFNPGLTVLFGENATGKTGYVRVFKRLSAVRSARPILGNVHDDPAVEPSARVDFRFAGGDRQELEWHDEAGVPPFTRMAVFDAACVPEHVDDDLSYTYTPSDLRLFDFTYHGIEQCRGLIDTAVRERRPSGNPFAPRVQRGTRAFAAIEVLGSTTDLDEIAHLAELGTGQGERLQTLRDRESALRPDAVKAQRDVAVADRDVASAIVELTDAVLSFDMPAFASAAETLSGARRRLGAAQTSSFEGEDIPGGVSPEWRRFIDAAEGFIQHVHGDGYPTDRDRCIYCRQEFGDAALALVRKYRQLARTELQQEVEAGSRNCTQLRAPLSSLNLDSIDGEVRSRRDAIDDGNPMVALLDTATTLISSLRPALAALRNNEVPEWDQISSTASGLGERARDVHTQRHDLVGTLGGRAEERAQAHAAALQDRNELEACVVLAQMHSDVRSHVERAKWADRAEAVAKRFTAVLRSLTEASKTASDQLLNRDFERRFEENCRALRAPTVQLEFPGRRGAAARRKVVAPEHRASEVLSEGEQKVLALADFLAEAGLRSTAAPFIFDDPVTSLDYKRLDEVVDRIEGLVDDQQVIVFTHNIWLTTALLARFEKQRDRCTYYDVSEIDGRFGVVTSGSHPRWDTVSKTRGRINELIQSAKSAQGETQAALVEKAYDLMRNWCESVVETELFQGVTQRYQPHVAMTRLENIHFDRLQAAADTMRDVFEKACRKIAGHSQPLETLGQRPTLTELEDDWDRAQRA